MSKWIDPAERLPEDDETVLAIASGHGINMIMERAYVLAIHGDTGWDLSDDVADELTVHWWMPLPAEPDEENEPAPLEPKQYKIELDVNACPICGRRPLVEYTEIPLSLYADPPVYVGGTKVTCKRCGISAESLEQWNRLRAVEG